MNQQGSSNSFSTPEGLVMVLAGCCLSSVRQISICDIFIRFMEGLLLPRIENGESTNETTNKKKSWNEIQLELFRGQALCPILECFWRWHFLDTDGYGMFQKFDFSHTPRPGNLT